MNINRRPIFILQIGGLRYRYTSGPATPATIEGHPDPAPTYTDVNAIVGVGNLKASLDLIGGVESRAPIDIQLASRGRAAGCPCAIFSRVGRRAASAFALVTAPVDAATDPPVDVLVDRDLSGLDWPAMVHLNGELCYVSGADGSDPDPSDADPFRVTVTARGMGGTPRRTHTPQPAQADFPYLTIGDPVFWRGRPAVLLAEPADRSTPPREIMRGFIDATPKPSRGGTVYTVALVPDSAKFDDELDLAFPASSTTMVTGYHLFDGVAGSIFTTYQVQAPLFSAARDATAAGSGLIDVEPGFADTWADHYDPALPFGHPRAGDLIVNRRTAYKVTGTAADGGDLSFTLAAGPDADVRARESLATRRAIEEVRAVIVERGAAPEVLVWPGTADDGLDGVAGRISAAAADTAAGADGSTFAVTLLSGGDLFRIDRLTPDPGFLDPIAIYPVIVPEFVEGDLAPWQLIERVTGVRPTRWADLGGGLVPAPPAGGREVLWVPVFPAASDQISDVDGAGRRTACRRFSASAPSTIRRGEVADAWYQVGERYLLVNDELDVSSGEVVVRFDRLDVAGEAAPRFIVAEVTGIEPILLGAGPRAGETVYAIEVARPGQVPSFRQGGPSQTVTAITILSGTVGRTGTGEALRRLLRDEAALGLPEASVDGGSILALADPPWAPSLDLGALAGSPEDLTVGDVASAVCALTRTAIVQRTDSQGRCRLTRIPVGVESATDVIAIIGAGDWSARDIPEGDFDDEITNRVIISHDYDAAEGEFLSDPPAVFNDRASQAAYGERASVEIRDFSGVPVADPARTFAPFAAGLFRSFAEPRTTYRGRVSTALGLQLGPGAVVRLSSPALRDSRGNLGVADVIARVVEVDVGLWTEGASLTLVSFGGGGAGWSVSCRVESVEADDKVVVEANAYAAEEGVNGAEQSDLDFFAAGQTVRCEPALNQDAGVQRTIAADGVDRVSRSITFTAAHGLAVGDLIVATVRGSAPAAHLGYAWLGDGVGDDETLIG